MRVHAAAASRVATVATGKPAATAVAAAAAAAVEQARCLGIPLLENLHSPTAYMAKARAEAGTQPRQPPMDGEGKTTKRTF